MLTREQVAELRRLWTAYEDDCRLLTGTSRLEVGWSRACNRTNRSLAAFRRAASALAPALLEAAEIASGRTMYDAAAVEREACAVMVDAESCEHIGGFPVYSESNRERLSDLATRIRARKEQANG